MAGGRNSTRRTATTNLGILSRLTRMRVGVFRLGSIAARISNSWERHHAMVEQAIEESLSPPQWPPR